MQYELPALPYSYGALEPTIDELTMRIHHGKHHAGYVTNLNAALEQSDWLVRPIEQLLCQLDSLPEAIRTTVRNNSGGHANHTLFWDVMTPDGGGGPSGPLADAVDAEFQSVRNLKRQVSAQFGSGWTWLIHDGAGLAVTSTPNQDSPLMNGHTPLLGIDVREHGGAHHRE